MTIANTQSAPSSSSPLDLAPALGVLDKTECEAILARNVVGRLAFALHDHVNIVPVHFVYREGWIYGRTAPGGKLLDIVRNRRVAFEVDEDEGFFSWRSVVVHGSLYLIDPARSVREKDAYDIALRLLRQGLPTTLGDADPVPFRTELFRIQVSEISGRSSKLGGTKIAPGPERTADVAADAEGDAVLAAAVRGAIARVYPKTGRIRVDAFDEVVVLSGTVDTAADRSTIERAVLELDNVSALVQQIETVHPAQSDRSPPELAREALRELRGNDIIRAAEIKIVVEHDWLRAEGFVETKGAKLEAMRRLRSVRGARGVIDRVHVASITPNQIGEEAPYENSGVD